VAKQQSEGEKLYVLVHTQVEQQSQYVVGQPAESKEHGQQQQDTGHTPSFPDESCALWTGKRDTQTATVY
jgi:hypothetical protein